MDVIIDKGCGLNVHKDTVDKQSILAGNHLFDPIGQILPSFFRQCEICPQVEEHPLPGDTLVRTDSMNLKVWY